MSKKQQLLEALHADVDRILDELLCTSGLERLHALEKEMQVTHFLIMSVERVEEG